MIMVNPLAADDLSRIVAQPGQAGEAGKLALVAQALEGSRAWTVRDADSRNILFCGGIIEHHPGYASLWCLLSAQAGPAMLALTRRVRARAEALEHGRVDMILRFDFPQAARWAELLGFAREARLHGYWPDGTDALIYRRINR